MGTATNKGTRKYSKRHLGKALKQRRKTQWVHKQKEEKNVKLQKAVRRATDRQRVGDEQRELERQEEVERDQYLRTNQEDASSDMEEVDDFDNDPDILLEDDASDKTDSVKSSSESTIHQECCQSSLVEQGASQEETEKDIEEEIAQYRQQLANLKDKDPEFYKYLQEADEQLLHFPTEDNRPTQHDQEMSLPDADVRRLTFEQVDSWCRSVSSEEMNMTSLRSLMTAFAFACQYGDLTEDDQDMSSLLQFGSPTVYSKLMIFVLKNADGIFRRYLKLKKRIDRNSILTCLKKHEDVTVQLQRYLNSACRLLKQSIEDNVLAFVLRHVRSSVVFMEHLPAKISKISMRSALEIFTLRGPAPRLQAVLFIREMVMKLGENTVHLCLKGVYKAFVSSSSTVNKDTVPDIHFMGTCVIEIYSLCPDGAYQNAFKSIKDLAVSLRETIIVKDKDSWKKVCSWRCIHCLELWARLVGALQDKGDIRHLIYPIAQLLTGTARFLDQMAYLPMRLRLIAAANRLSLATGVFIPVASQLTGILSWSHLQKRPVTTGKQQCPNLALCLHVDDKTLKNPAFQNEIVEQVLELLTQHLAQFSHSIAFPETSHWVAVQLKKFAKTVRSPSYKSGVMQVATAMQESAEVVLSRRMLVTFSPRDVAQVEQFEREGKTTAQSPLEKLAARLEVSRQQRAKLHSTDVVVLKEPYESPTKRTKQKKEKDVSLSDAESLTSDEGSLKEEELQGIPEDMPEMEDVLEDYVLSDDDRIKNRNAAKNAEPSMEMMDVQLPKQKRRKERRKMQRQKTKREH